MNDKPEESFGVNLGGTKLSITGKEYENLPTATLELDVATGHTSEIVIGTEKARDLVKSALKHQVRPLEGYVPETRKIAYEWAGLEYEEE